MPVPCLQRGSPPFLGFDALVADSRAMARLKHMVGRAVIDGFRGVIDFYYYMGLPCARKWPRKPITSRNQNVMAQWPIFTRAAYLWGIMPPDMKYWYEEMAKPTNLTGKDLFFRGYISGILRYYCPPGEC